MSCYIVTKNHLLYLTAALCDNFFYCSNQSIAGSAGYANDTEGRLRLVNDLLDANVKAFKERYGDRQDEDIAKPITDLTPEEPYQPKMAPRYTLVELLKAIDCFSYQCCDATGWHESVLGNLMAWLKNNVVTKLPGYEEAPWGCLWDENAEPARRPLGGAEMSDEDAEKVGALLAEVLQLDYDDKDRVFTTWGTKSNRGLARTVARIVNQED